MRANDGHRVHSAGPHLHHLDRPEREAGRANADDVLSLRHQHHLDHGTGRGRGSAHLSDHAGIAVERDEVN